MLPDLLLAGCLATCLALPSCGQSIRAAPPQASPSTAVSAGEQQTGEQARPADAFVDSIGANVHLSYFDTGYGDFKLIKKRLLDLGARHLRDGAQLTADVNYNNIFYGRLKDLAESGIRFDLVFDPRSSMGQLTPGKLSAVAALAGNSLETVEGPNEYDNSNREDRNWAYTLREYQADLYQTVKSDPLTRNMAVIGPSFVHAESRDAIGDLSPYLDYGNLHSYPGGRIPTSNLMDGENEIVRARKVSGTRPLVSSETGYHTAVASRGGHPGISDKAFAKYICRLYLEYFNRGFTRTYLYEISDEKSDPGRTDPEHNFGLLTSAGEPKPAYFSLRNLIYILDETRAAGLGDAKSVPTFSPGQLRYQLQGVTSEIHHTLLQKRDGRFYLLLWHETSSYDIASKADISVPKRRLLLQLSQAHRVNDYLPLESSNVIEHYDGRTIPLDVPDHVLIVEIIP